MPHSGFFSAGCFWYLKKCPYTLCTLCHLFTEKESIRKRHPRCFGYLNSCKYVVCNAISPCPVSCYLGAEVQGAVEGDKIPPNLFFSRSSLSVSSLNHSLQDFFFRSSTALLLFGHNVFLVLRSSSRMQEGRHLVRQRRDRISSILHLYTM